MPDVDNLGPLWGAAGAIATAIGVFAVKWFRAGKHESRADYAAANMAWKNIADFALARSGENEKRIDGLTDAVTCLNERVTDCQAKHEECERQHQECEEKHTQLTQRLVDLEGSVRVVENKVANGHK